MLSLAVMTSTTDWIGGFALVLGLFLVRGQLANGVAAMSVTPNLAPRFRGGIRQFWWFALTVLLGVAMGACWLGLMGLFE